MKFAANLFAACLLLCFVLIDSPIAQVSPPPPPPRAAAAMETPQQSQQAQKRERDPKKEEKIQQQLQKIAPKAVEKFKAATVALDAQRNDESAKLFAEVLRQAPDFEPALRREGFALIGLGRRDEGLQATQKAVDLNRSPDNLISLAYNITEFFGAGTYQPTPGEFAEALALTKEAAEKDTENSPEYPIAVAQFALNANNWQDFTDASKTLAAKFPDLLETHYFNSIRFADAGEFATAEAELKRAETLGMPHEAAQDLRAQFEQAKNAAANGSTENDEGFFSYFGIGNYFYYGLYVVGAWAFGLLALFVAGKILSAKTLRTLESSDPNDVTGGGHAQLRNIYKKVITIAGVYYYISQPIVLLLVIVAALAAILFFFWIGRIPIKLVLIIAFVALATVFYMIKSLLARTTEEDPGRILTEAEAPGLWALARDVAQTIKTRGVDEIRITHGSELAVYERGGFRQKMNDEATRILIVGAATLNGFTQNAFRAVLAHEYGHFSNRDTAGGAIALRVNLDIIRFAQAMAQSGTATVYNIAFQFLRLYHFLFRRITHGATRLQEILADRVAVREYGASAFQEGLTHVIRRDLEFDHVATTEINAAFGTNRQMQNLYELSVQDETAKKNLEQEYEKAVSRPTTEDDTHPSPQDRFRLAAQIKLRAECAPIDGMVWDLFKDREALTKEMNASLETKLRALS